MTVWLQATFCNPPGGCGAIVRRLYGDFFRQLLQGSCAKHANHWNSCCGVFGARFNGEHEIGSTFVCQQGRICGVEISLLFHFIYIYQTRNHKDPHPSQLQSWFREIYTCVEGLPWHEFNKSLVEESPCEEQQKHVKLFFVFVFFFNIGTVIHYFNHFSSMSDSGRIGIIVRSRCCSSKKVRSEKHRTKK